jgi:flavodoxin
MKALIVYSSWLGHNRAIARLLADELSRRGVDVACAPAQHVRPSDLAGYDLLVLGTYSHKGHTSRRLRALCTTIPLRQFERMEVAVFGVQMAWPEPHPTGVDELMACLGERGCELAAAPLRFELPGIAAYRRARGLGAADRARVAAFADELWEATVPEPIL